MKLRFQLRKHLRFRLAPQQTPGFIRQRAVAFLTDQSVPQNKDAISLCKQPFLVGLSFRGGSVNQLSLQNERGEIKAESQGNLATPVPRKPLPVWTVAPDEQAQTDKLREVPPQCAFRHSVKPIRQPRV